MTWYRVDDGFHSHDKVARIPRSIRAEAIGTWTLCGTWSADKERDGFVPAHIVDEVGGTAAGADALVAVKLWRRRRDGFAFVNWEEYQFTRAQLVEKRKSESERKAEYRARKARESGVESAHVPAGQERDPLYPSRPVPDDEDQDTLPRPTSGKGPAFDDLSPDVKSVVENVARYVDRDVHPLVVPDIVAWIENRRGPNAKPLQNRARYYATTIRSSWTELQQFIDKEGLAS